MHFQTPKLTPMEEIELEEHCRRKFQAARKNRHELLRREGRRWRRRQVLNALAFGLLLGGMMFLLWWQMR